MNWHERHDEETTMYISGLREFLRGEVLPVWRDLEEAGQFPHEIVSKMGLLGILGLTIPDEYGGLGKGTYLSSLIARELAYIWPSLHLNWSANASLAAVPIMLAGTEEQKQKYLPRLASGEILGCYALTEADSGSDAASLETTAVKNGDVWFVRGAKMFITNAAQASIGVIFARTGEKKHDISAFIIESGEGGTLGDYPGVTVNPISKRGLHSSIFCEIVLDDVCLPQDALLGRLHEGFPIAMATLDGGRINIAAQAVGMAASVLDAALIEVKRRKQFGRPVWENQGVQFHFADWVAELRAAWALVEQVSRLRDAGYTPITEMASCAKLFATVTAKRICSNASEYFGAVGYTEDHWILSRVLDSFAPPIYEGSSNVQRIVIARELGKEVTT